VDGRWKLVILFISLRGKTLRATARAPRFRASRENGCDPTASAAGGDGSSRALCTAEVPPKVSITSRSGASLCRFDKLLTWPTTTGTGSTQRCRGCAVPSGFSRHAHKQASAKQGQCFRSGRTIRGDAPPSRIARITPPIAEKTKNS